MAPRATKSAPRMAKSVPTAAKIVPEAAKSIPTAAKSAPGAQPAALALAGTKWNQPRNQVKRWTCRHFIAANRLRTKWNQAMNQGKTLFLLQYFLIFGARPASYYITNLIQPDARPALLLVL